MPVERGRARARNCNRPTDVSTAHGKTGAVSYRRAASGPRARAHPWIGDAEIMAESAIPSTGEVDVAIVGAGAAGLAAARVLSSRRPGLAVVVLEAAARLGGRALTIDALPIGAPLDLGCGWLHGARSNPWTSIAEGFGFTIDRTPPPWDRQHENLGFPPDEQEDYERAATAFHERMAAAADE